MTYDLRVTLESFENTGPREGFLTEPRSDIGQNGCLYCILFVKNSFECSISWSKTVEEMLGEDPTAARINICMSE